MSLAYLLNVSAYGSGLATEEEYPYVSGVLGNAGTSAKTACMVPYGPGSTYKATGIVPTVYAKAAKSEIEDSSADAPRTPTTGIQLWLDGVAGGDGIRITDSSYSDIIYALEKHGPLNVAHCAGTLMAYDSGILSDSCVEINHAVLLVGCALLTFARSPDSIST